MIRKFRIYILAAVILADAVALYTLFKGFWVFPTLNAGKGVSILLNAVSFALFCAVLSFSVVSGRNKLKASLSKSAVIAIWSAVLGLAGKFASKFLLPEGTLVIFPIAMAAIFAIILIIYCKCRKRAADKVSATAIRKSAAASGQLKYTYTLLYGDLTVLLIADILHFSLTLGGPSWNQETFLPLTATLISLILWRIVKWRGFLLPAVAVDLFFLFKLVHGLVSTCGSQALGVSLAAFLVFVPILLPLADLYCRKEENI